MAKKLITSIHDKNCLLDILIDLSKAFDAVDHKETIQKYYTMLYCGPHRNSSIRG